ncbi:hypothetical protein [Paraburkholderia tropica]|uniref:hypothetical protein n=1 Tax=Paraburkholderia tropica TaxID=92647 RepID=UPI002AB66A9B|nr:hypothetical protein [Paraburkholderia tropica]
MLNREQILGAVDVKTEDVDVPEWGGTVRIAVMSGVARDALQASVVDNKSPSRFEAALVAATAVDESGALLFSADDVATLQAKNATVLTRVAAVAMALNNIGKKAAEEAVKNSEAAQSGDSGTA